MRDFDKLTAFRGRLTHEGSDPRDVVFCVPKCEIPDDIVDENFHLPPGSYGWVFIREATNQREQTLITQDIGWFEMLQQGLKNAHVVDNIDLPIERFQWRCGGWWDEDKPRYGESLVKIPHRGIQ